MKRLVGILVLILSAAVMLSACGGGGGGGGSAGVTTPQQTTVRLAETGQTACYDANGLVLTSCVGTGEDGEKRAGVAWPNPRFTTSADTTVSDNLTGLVWAPDAGTPTFSGTTSTCTGGEKSWQAALDYVSCLNMNNYLGHNDWRLPNRKELRSLANYGLANNATWLNGNGFTNVQGVGYWSSTSYAIMASLAWGVNMGHGNVYIGDKISPYRVLPVRTGPSVWGGALSDLQKTGQTVSYGSRDDGALQKGVTWPNLRFAVNSDATVRDNLTGLAWAPNGNLMPTRDTGWDADGVANDGAVTWQHALNYVAKLNMENYLGHNDWRLPNVNELESLVHAGQSNSAVWLNSLGFSSVDAGIYGIYWSSTTYAGIPGNAWYVHMRDGEEQVYSKNGFNYVWPVREGQ